ncbi:toprim domain-containing protein [Streptomyces rectiverticillatus]|uniref:toprim domain-containing protein n=1 Tax=Streptomyces rectiverticillatus TaxID=173860 RepID=UPI001FEC05A2|nr:toprim domain-containing protein [Streptomyces rectiverticillatus]
MTFQLPSKSRIDFLTSAAKAYHDQAAGSAAAGEYLSTLRGLSWDTSRFFQLGVVEEPLPGHERYAGRLAIPYINAQGVVAIRFRCIEHPLAGIECKSVHSDKYQREPGDKAKLYNLVALTRHADRIAICEGEIDTMTAWQAGIPAVGVGGVQNWQKRFRRHFDGYHEVIVLTDADDNGQGSEMGDMLCTEMSNARAIAMPHGRDVNSYYMTAGAESLVERATFA